MRKEHGYLNFIADITVSEVSDVDVAEEKIHKTLFDLGSDYITTTKKEQIEDEVTFEATIEIPAVKKSERARFDDDGGDPGYTEIEAIFDEYDIENAFDSDTYIRVKEKQFVAA